MKHYAGGAFLLVAVVLTLGRYRDALAEGCKPEGLTCRTKGHTRGHSGDAGGPEVGRVAQRCKSRAPTRCGSGQTRAPRCP